MSNSDVIGVRNAELREEVEDYCERAGYDQLSKGAEDLLKVGLRETRAPLLTRLFEQATIYAHLLCVFALVFLAGGVVTEAIEFGNALVMAIVLVGVAILGLGVVQAAKVLKGANALGDAVHGWWA